MKTALALVCSLLLVGTLFVPPTARAAGDAGAARGCCCDCSTAACCAAKTLPAPHPASAAPVPVSLQHQLLAPAFGVLAWTLPEAEASPPAAFLSTPPVADGAPLFARHCARLI